MRRDTENYISRQEAAASPGPGEADLLHGAHRFRFVDVLRFFAATSVLVQHIFEISTSSALVRVTALSPGVFGVILFFMVSGFVMPISVKKGLRLGDFAIRRLFRIYPALLTAFALWAGLQLLLGGPNALIHHATLKDWIANVFLIQDFTGSPGFLGVTWTLILEFTWYALFALSAMMLGRQAGGYLVIMFAICMIATIVASLAIGHRLPVGRIGMIYAAVIGMRTYHYFAGSLSGRRLATDAAIFLLLMEAACFVSYDVFRHPTISFWQGAVPWLIAPLIFFTCAGGKVHRSWIMQSKLLSWLGSISLSIYLFHPIAMMVCAGVANDLGRIATTLLVTLGMAAISYFAVEKPGIDLGRRLASLQPMRRDNMTVGRGGFDAL